MLISMNSRKNCQVSLEIGKIDFDTKTILFDVVIAKPKYYKRIAFASFRQAVDIYNDMLAQYIDD